MMSRRPTPEKPHSPGPGCYDSHRFKTAISDRHVGVKFSKMSRRTMEGLSTRGKDSPGVGKYYNGVGSTVSASARGGVITTAERFSSSALSRRRQEAPTPGTYSPRFSYLSSFR